MSRYYDVKLKKDHEFIVVKHSLPGYEGEIHGVKYRQGYAVVIKNSRVYRDLKKIRPFAIKEEHDICKLADIKCVINERQIQYIWGKAVYDYYKQVKFKTDNPSDIRTIMENKESCAALTAKGTPCQNKVVDGSTYCIKHIQLDERIKEDCEKMGKMPVKEKKILLRKLIEEKIKSQVSE